MKVKVIEEIFSAKGVIPAGQIIEITQAVFEKLAGKVEMIPFDLEPLVDILRDRQRELDGLGCWTGCREWLDEQPVLLAETRSAAKAVDSAFQEQNPCKVKASIETYYQAWRRVFDDYHTSQAAPQQPNETQGTLTLA